MCFRSADELRPGKEDGGDEGPNRRSDRERLRVEGALCSERPFRAGTDREAADSVSSGVRELSVRRDESLVFLLRAPENEGRRLKL
jgi:hypothetical protein